MTTSLDLKTYPILVVDDDADILTTFRFAFEDQFTILTANSGREALQVLDQHPVAVLIADQRMPEMHGVDLIREAVDRHPALVPIVLTGFTDYQDLVKAMNVGSIFRYIPKPWEPHELRHALASGIERHHLARENARLTTELAAANVLLAQENRFFKERETRDSGLKAIVGESPAIQQMRDRIRRVLDSSAAVLLQGPTGTGKELVARAIHYDGPRREKLFAAVNCAALSEELLASELFGHKKGAFTGAIADKKGLFQLAEGGTVFLDEISETSPKFQAALLRVLAERTVQPLGELSRSIPVDARVIAATNRDLEADARAGRFREDLYFRLAVVPITVPPLSARRDDIGLLVDHFLEHHCAAHGRPPQHISAQAMIELEQREYRGNIRELSNLIERAVLLSDRNDTITAEHLFDRPAEEVPSGGPGETQSLSRTILRYERAILVEALEKHAGHRGKTAEALNITSRWLAKLLKRHKME